jgi:type I restriction enzyme S subunit
MDGNIAMSKGWKAYSLSELTSVITKGTTPSTYGFNFEDSGINYIRAQSLNYDGTIDEDVFSFISEEAHSKLKRSQLKSGDILFSMAGAYLGMVGMVKESFCPANTNQAVGIIRVNSSLVDPKFVEYSLRNPSTVAFVNAQSGQSAQPNINLTEIGNLSFKFPPLPEQKAIASILSALDDKIELNLAMNKTLEEMAMALYKHWFVDFGPFQDGEFVDSELGLIPEGWEVKMFGDIVIKYIDNRGKTPPIVEEGIPLLEVKHIRSNLFPNLQTQKKVTSDVYNSWFRSHLEENDIIISTVGTTGLTCLVPREHQVCIAQNLLGIRFNSTKLPRAFMFYLMKSSYFLNQIENRLVITVQNSIKRKDLNIIPVISPPHTHLQGFANQVDDYLDKIESNINENITLTTLRDTLLPKLISGEVRVKDIENQVAQAL